MIIPHNLRNLVVVDTETTGENPFVHELLSAALVPLASNDAFEVHVRVAGGSAWTDYGRNVFSNFEERWKEKATTPIDAVRSIEAFVESHFSGEEINLVGHNVAFDRFFLARLAFRAGVSSIRGISHRTIDTYSLLTVLHLLGRIPKDATSSSGAFEYFGISFSNAERHTALGDAMATKRLFIRLLNELKVATV